MVSEDSEEKKQVKESKLIDKCQKFSANKLRSTIVCDSDSCGTIQAVHSDFDVGRKKGPSKAHLNNLMALLENGYICGNAIIEDTGFFVKMQMRCGDYIESQYYIL